MKTIQASDLKPGDVIFGDKVVATVWHSGDDGDERIVARCFSLYTGLYDRWFFTEFEKIEVEDSAAVVTEALVGMIRELRQEVHQLRDQVRELGGKG